MSLPITINRLPSPKSRKVSCKVNDVSVDAVVDTAAMVTIISETVYEKLSPKPPVIGSTVMKAAGENLTFSAHLVGPISFTTGSTTLQTHIFVGPITDDMLFGLELLKRVRAVIDLDRDLIRCNNEILPLNQESRDKGNGRSEVSAVALPQPLKIPSNSEVVFPISLEEACWNSVNSDLLLLEPAEDLPVFVARAIYSYGKPLAVNILNASDTCIRLPANSVLGTLHCIAKDEVTPSVMKIQADAESLMDSPSQIPERLLPIWEATHSDLSPVGRERLKKLLCDHADIFASSKSDLGSFNALHHKIDTGNADPVKLGLRRTPVHYQSDEDRILEEMLAMGVIEPSYSSWAAAPVLVRKKSGEFRYCIDYRSLNNLTKKDVYPIPLMSECIDALDGNIWFSKLDSNSAYWQVPLDPSTKHKTAFRTRLGLFEFNRLPFGLCNAPSTFGRVMELTLKGMHWKSVLVFLDDICVLGRSEQDHLDNLGEVFSRFRHYGLKLEPSKCTLFQKEVEFLGRLVSTDGVTLTDHSISTIMEWRTPSSVKEVQRFLGLANYHRSFFKNFSSVAEPLNKLLKAKEFKWGTEQEESFKKLKLGLVSPPVLAIPCATGKFILDCDASNEAIGGELLQVQHGTERVIAFASFSLSKHEKRYCTTRKELLAVVRFTRHFRHYLLGCEFKIRTDHNSLIWLMNFRHPQGQLARWLEELSSYSMTIEYRPGRLHGNADALSRRPHPVSCSQIDHSFNSSDLPCKGCKTCTRSLRLRSDFDEHVDNVTSLTASNKLSASKLEESYAGLDVIIPVVKAVGPASVWDNDRIVRAQAEDPQLRFLRAWLHDRDQPSDAVLLLSGKAEKFYWINRELFFLEDGIVFRSHEDERFDDLLVVPASMKSDVLQLCHDIPSAGHQGISRTKERVKSAYFWYKMSTDIKNYVVGCSSCNQNKTGNRKKRYPLTQYHAGVPMEKVHIDFMGPLPKTPRGNEHILVLVDQFTKWVEAIPLPSQDAETTAKAAVNEFFTRFGFPLQLISDQGRNFMSSLFKEVCKLLHIHQARTTAYRPSANGQAERANRTLISALRSFVNDKQNNWDEVLPLITSAIRSSKNRNTGFTPNKLMLGREIVSPSDIVIPGAKVEAAAPDDYVQKLQGDLQSAHETARKILQGELKREKRDYDVKAHTDIFRRGDAVYFVDKARTNKLKPCWVGPCLVMSVLTPYLYIVKIKNRETKVLNHDMLKRCNDSTLPAWILNEQHSMRLGEKIKYCFCRRPDDGKLMVMCESCLEWYHAACIQMTKKQIKSTPKFICSRCPD